MKKKQGISLIVLVITIIVMIILAAAVVITLSNSGIINRATHAVKITNAKQVEQLASLAWAEAYADGVRTESELEAAVTEALKGYDTTGYTITVTTNGVNVTEGNEPNKELNEYGFYYDYLYVGDIDKNLYMVQLTKMAVAILEDNTFLVYVGLEAADGVEEDEYMAQIKNKLISWSYVEKDNIIYASKKIDIGGEWDADLTVSEDGKRITGSMDGIEVDLECIYKETAKIQIGKTYTATGEVFLNSEDTEKMRVTETYVVNSNNTITMRTIITSLDGVPHSDVTETAKVVENIADRFMEYELVSGDTTRYGSAQITEDGQKMGGYYLVLQLQ